MIQPPINADRESAEWPTLADVVKLRRWHSVSVRDCREHKKYVQPRMWAIRGIRPSIRHSVTAEAGAFASGAAYATAWERSGWPVRQAFMDGRTG